LLSVLSRQPERSIVEWRSTHLEAHDLMPDVRSRMVGTWTAQLDQIQVGCVDRQHPELGFG